MADYFVSGQGAAQSLAPHLRTAGGARIGGVYNRWKVPKGQSYTRFDPTEASSREGMDWQKMKADEDVVARLLGFDAVSMAMARGDKAGAKAAMRGGNPALGLQSIGLLMKMGYDPATGTFGRKSDEENPNGSGGVSGAGVGGGYVAGYGRASAPGGSGQAVKKGLPLPLILGAAALAAFLLFR